jgi:hypothetical protein
MIRTIRRVVHTAIAVAALTVSAAFAAAPAVDAQEPPPAVVAGDSLYEIRLTDGSSLIGRVVADDGDELVVETAAGARINLRRSQIRSLRLVRGKVVNGEMWLEDPHATRLFFGPTARAVPQGEGYFGVYELFFPFVTYGVTDRFTISGGTPVVPGAIGEAFYVAPKLEVMRTPTASAAVGVLAFFATRELDGTAGLLYGVGTFGGPDRALTVGATVPFIATSGDAEIGREPALMLGGEARMTRRTKFISENYFVPSVSYGLLSGGVRFFGERLSADFGLGAAFGEGSFECCLPLVNFVYSFGGSR